MEKIHWHLGQALLPEHFNLEQQLNAKQASTFSYINCPTGFFGLAELDVDAFYFSKNILKIKSLLYITPKGECIFHENTTDQKLLELNLNALETESAIIALAINNDPKVKSQKYNDTVIQTQSPNISLIVNPESIDELQLLSLMQLNKLENGKWELGKLLPPLLTTNVYSFSIITTLLNETMLTLNAYLQHERATNTAISPSKVMQLQNIELQLNKSKIKLLQLSSIKSHPFYIYQDIIEIYLYLLQYQDEQFSEIKLNYNHNNPWNSFQNLCQRILSRVQYTHSIEYKNFKVMGNKLATDTINYEALNRKKHYFVIRKPTENFLYQISNIKLTSPERVSHVNEYSLTGLKLKKLDFNPLPGSGVDKLCDVFEILPSREWDYIMAEQKIALLKTKEINDLKFTYYYV